MLKLLFKLDKKDLELQAVSLKILPRYCIIKEISISYHIVKKLKVPIPLYIGQVGTLPSIRKTVVQTELHLTTQAKNLGLDWLINSLY